MTFRNGDYVTIGNIDNKIVFSDDKAALIATIVDSFFDEGNQEVWYEVDVGIGLGLGVFRTEYSESDLIKLKKGC